MKTKPDGYLPDGTPVYLAMARGNSKPTLQLYMYAKMHGVPDEELEEMMREVEYLLYGNEKLED